jgi:hypothetical protein
VNAAFDPVVDSLTLPVPVNLDAGWHRRWHTTVVGDGPRVLKALRQSFGGAVDLHEVAEWLDAPPPAHALPDAGWVFAALDYFMWPALPAHDTPQLRAYIQERHLDCWRQNGAALLEWLAVQQRVPEEWLPRALIEHQLAALLRRLPSIAHVEVRAEISVRPAGGACWLREHSLDHWQILHERTAGGLCCPVVAFVRGRAWALLAFRSGEGIRGYDPNRPGPPIDVEPDSIDGLFMLRYEPAQPPLSGYQRAAGAVGLGRIAWKLARTWRSLRRARS